MKNLLDLTNIFLIAAGGGIGAVSRYIVTVFAAGRLGTAFPWGTMSVNLLGSFLMGALMMGLLQTRWEMSETCRMLLTVGFLGGFTTFSSFSLETLTLLMNHNFLLAGANIFVNCAGGILAAFLGMTAVRALM